MQKDSEALAAFLRGKKVAFIGAGVSHKTLIGQFCAMGAEVTLCDKKQLEDFGDYAETLKQLGVRLSLGEHYLDGLAGQQVIMRTPGFEYYTPALQAAKAAGSIVTSEMELFFDYCPCHITAVTGSDGKTTTTSLIAAMLTAAGKKVHLGGNIGRALLPILAEIDPGDEAVVELSSFQLISMRKSPRVAVVTNVTPNHLDHHKDMQEYVDAKRNILLWQTPADKAVKDDHIRPNQLFAITLGAVTDPELCKSILETCSCLLVPGAIRSLADRPTEYQLPVCGADGRLLNDPSHPYRGTYEGDEDTRRKPAYHNGTAWTWPFPSYCEAWVMTYGDAGRDTARSLLSSSEIIMRAGCVGQIAEIVDGDYPHTQRGCDAQAWSMTEVYRVWKMLH